MKRKLLFLSAVLMCFAIAAAGTLAYFVDEDTAHNVVTTGGVNIEVIEQMKDGDTLVDFPQEGISDVMPGTSVSKIVQVKNTGKADAWIRVHVSMSIKSVDGSDLPLELENGTPAMTFKVMDGWVAGEDGYFYYKTPVAPEKLTDALFEEVLFDGAIGNEYQNCTANLVVGAQAVQSANNVIPDGGDVTDIVGWPAEEGEK